MNKEAKAEYIRQTQRIAKSLGLPSYGPDADAGIVDYCYRQVSAWAAENGPPMNLEELLNMVASALDVEFVEIYSDDDLSDLISRIPLSIEPALATVLTEFSNDTDAVTIRRLDPQPWERRYLAVINCRGMHYHRRYFTKWHELGHRLVEGEQLKSACRPSSVAQKDPGEVLVDKVAGVLAFYPEIVEPVAKKHLSSSGLRFETADSVRCSVAKEASRQATALALLSYVDRPAWYLRCSMSLKPSENRSKSRPDGQHRYVAKLRIVEVTPNASATQSGIRIHQWMRVPESSLVFLTWQSGMERSGHEILDQWETSAGGPIGDGCVSVDTWIVDDEVFVLVSLTDDPTQSSHTVCPNNW